MYIKRIIGSFLLLIVTNFSFAQPNAVLTGTIVNNDKSSYNSYLVGNQHPFTWYMVITSDNQIPINITVPFSFYFADLPQPGIFTIYRYKDGNQTGYCTIQVTPLQSGNSFSFTTMHTNMKCSASEQTITINE